MLNALLDFISPRACHLCGKRLAVSEKNICAVCNWHLPRTGYAETAYDNPMARLFWGRFKVERAAAWIFYQSHGEPSKLIYKLKYHGRREIGEWLGRNAAEEFKDNGFFDDIDCIVPVPITWQRRFKRGYNQSEVIAHGISEVTGLPVLSNCVKRKGKSESQTHLSPDERMQNVLGAFNLCCPEKIKGRHILLVDDVVTTGATICSCAETLSEAGDVRISVLTIGCAKS